MKMINLTPHALHFIRWHEGMAQTITIQHADQVARLVQLTEPCGEINQLPVFLTSYGKITGLPEPEPDTIYLVSGLVLAAVPFREDVFAPDNLIQNEEGAIIGVSSLFCTPAYLEKWVKERG